MNERILNIKEKEAFHNSFSELLDQINVKLDEWEILLPKYKQLMDYYGSQQWREDYESSEKNEFPEDLACGILTEDTLYNLFRTQRELALRMLKAATSALEN